MDGRTVAAVALRIWGLVFLLEAIAVVPASALAVRAIPVDAEPTRFGRVVLFQLAASAILGLCLLVWADSIARRVIPETGPLQLGVDAAQLLSIGLLLVGVVTLLQGLKEAAGLAYVLATKPKWVEASATSYLWERESQAVVPAVVNVVAGIILIVGRGGFARAWAQLRSFARTGHGSRER